MIACVYILVGLIGLCVGSFLNVVIYRVPNKMSLAVPPSHCPKCNYKLKWYDNIPVLSYIILGGKCRNCKEHISFRYTVVEIANMLLWLGCVWRFWDESLMSKIYACVLMVVCSVLVCVAFIDLETHIIPDGFHIVLLALGVATIFLDESVEWYERVTGMGANFLFFVLVFYVGRAIYKRDVLGGGDVKLSASIGLLLGWKSTLFSMLLATIVASIVLLIIRAKRHNEKGTEYAFAPFLVIGTLFGLFFGMMVADAYFGWLASI